MNQNIPNLSLLQQLPRQRILCVGDIMLDRYVYGQVERISPEAPVPVLRIIRERAMLGGCGNVVNNLVALQAQVEIVGVIGSDPYGFEVAELLGQQAGVTPHLLTDAARPTTLKIRFVAGNQQMIRADSESTAALTGPVLKQAVPLLESLVAEHRGGTLLLSDYNKGMLPPELLRPVIAAAQQNGMRIIVDPKGKDYQRYAGTTLITPNRKELQDATNMPVGTIAEVEQAARHLQSSAAVPAILVTLGAEGMVLLEGDQPVRHIPAIERSVFDVSGAGDTVAAMLAVGLAAGLPLLTAAQLANLAASVVVGKVGTATCSLDELQQEILRHESDLVDSKIVPSAIAAEMAERWRLQGLKVGFTNGCFDLLHPGHISLIRQARAACDRLIVGLNTDDSVRRLKGPERPVQNEYSRATVLAALADVDCLTFFGDDTPLELVRSVRPDVMIKGADYTVDRIAGADLVLAWGGKVVLADLEPGFSTSGTVQKLRQSGR